MRGRSNTGILLSEYTVCLAGAFLLSLAHQTAAAALYERPARAATLGLDHPLLSRAVGSPHQPEQIHLALSLSPGAVTISWVTHPQVNHRLPTESHNIIGFSAVLTLVHLVQEDLQLSRHKHHKHPDPACTHLEGIAVQSVVQYSVQSGTSPGPRSLSETYSAKAVPS